MSIKGEISNARVKNCPIRYVQVRVWRRLSTGSGLEGQGGATVLASDRVPFGAGTIQGHVSALCVEVTGFFHKEEKKFGVPVDIRCCSAIWHLCIL